MAYLAPLHRTCFCSYTTFPLLRNLLARACSRRCVTRISMSLFLASARSSAGTSGGGSESMARISYARS